jgi:hypothetical protein
MKTAYYDTKPAVYEAAGNGSYVYRWDIKEIEVPASTTEDSAATRMQWECKEVTVWTTVTREKLTAAVLGSLWASDYEAKLINDYNGAKEGVFGDESQKYIDRYTAFLNDRKAIKEKIAVDCTTFNVP